MNREDESCPVAVKILVGLVIAALAFLFGSRMGAKCIRREATQHGAAEYVVGADGESKFQWVEVKHGE